MFYLHSNFNPLSTYSSAKLTSTVENLKCAQSISLQPGSDGKVLAVAGADAVLRIFDIRISTTSTLLFFPLNLFFSLNGITILH